MAAKTTLVVAIEKKIYKSIKELVLHTDLREQFVRESLMLYTSKSGGTAAYEPLDTLLERAATLAYGPHSFWEFWPHLEYARDEFYAQYEKPEEGTYRIVLQEKDTGASDIGPNELVYWYGSPEALKNCYPTLTGDTLDIEMRARTPAVDAYWFEVAKGKKWKRIKDPRIQG